MARMTQRQAREAIKAVLKAKGIRLWTLSREDFDAMAKDYMTKGRASMKSWPKAKASDRRVKTWEG